MKILLTAFDPFGQEKINPALEAMKQVDVSRIAADIVKLEVPTVFGRAIDVVTEAMDREKPDAVLAIGQAGGRWALTPERVAINIDDAGIADNEGRQPADEAVVAGGPAAYFSTLPVKKMIQAIREAGLPAEVSNSAGTFVCNHLLYGMLHHIDRNYPGQMRAGFLHVPYIPEQVLNKPGKPSMSLPDIVRGIEAALEAIVVRPGP